MQKVKPFGFYDGHTGRSYTVIGIINDGSQKVQHDQDELDIIRFEGEGGKTLEAAKKARDADHDREHERAWRRSEVNKKRRKRKEQQKNYVMFGYRHK